MKFIIVAITGLVLSASAFAQSAAELVDERAVQQTLIQEYAIDLSEDLSKPPVITGTKWPFEWTNVYQINADGKQTGGIMYEPNIRTTWVDVNEAIAKMHNKKGAIVSPDYIIYRTGAKALLAPAYYADKVENFPTPELSKPEKPWVRLIQAKNTAQANCLAISKVNGQYSGCGDVWQGGLTESEMGCYEGQTYVACHLECVKKFSTAEIEYTPGSCK